MRSYQESQVGVGTIRDRKLPLEITLATSQFKKVHEFRGGYSL